MNANNTYENNIFIVHFHSKSHIFSGIICHGPYNPLKCLPLSNITSSDWMALNDARDMYKWREICKKYKIPVFY